MWPNQQLGTCLGQARSTIISCARKIACRGACKPLVPVPGARVQVPVFALVDASARVCCSNVPLQCRSSGWGVSDIVMKIIAMGNLKPLVWWKFNLWWHGGRHTFAVRRLSHAVARYMCKKIHTELSVLCTCVHVCVGVHAFGSFNTYWLNDSHVYIYVCVFTEWMCNTAREIGAATQPLSHSGRAAGPATRPALSTQPLWVTEWLSGCSSHSGRTAEWLSGCTKPLWQNVSVGE